jgi:methylmalonyl-CoA mutase N-terminal domain/subunit
LASEDEGKKEFITASSLPLKDYYVPKDLEGWDYLQNLGFPGEYPFTRGVQPTMYRGRLWTMRQYAGFGTAEESNQRYKYLLEQGQTGLSVAFDLSTQMGYDSDHPLASGEVGKVGVAIDSLEDMEILFNGIPLDKISTSMTINATASILLAMYLVVAEQQKVPWEKLNGTIQNDILKEYIARGTYIFPPKPSMRIVTDIFSFCSQKVPQWNTISISGYHIREAGSTAVQELAFTLANGLTYVQAALDSGLNVDVFASRLSFFFNAHNDFLEEIAKFRAARRMWAGFMRDKFGAKKEASWKLRFHTQTGGSTLAAKQANNNIVRVALQALAAVLGGTQSLHTNSRDEALALPSEDSVRIALRTQQIIAHESGVASTIDPLAGSYVIETLTNQLEEKCHEYLDKIDQRGGVLKAIEKGFIQREIQDSAYRYQQALEKEEAIQVGVNRFQLEKEEAKGELLKVDPAVEKNQREKLSRLKKNRDQKVAEGALNNLRQVAQAKDNLMPAIIDAVRVKATLGEISDELRKVFGEYKEVAVF